MKKIFVIILTILATLSSAFSEDVPKHIQLAREIVQNVKPDNNYYSNSNRHISLPTDLFSSSYRVNTDCLGLVEEVVWRASKIDWNFSTKKFQDRYSIIDFVNGVDRGEGPKKIQKITDLKPGDVVAWKYLIDYKVKYNGHIVFVDSAPVKVNREPKIDGLIQWEIWIIDSSTGPASPDDTRYVKGTSAAQADGALTTKAEALKQTGIGRGRIYLYSDGEGNFKAMSYAFRTSKPVIQDVGRHFVMARP
jgi:hypothetical protein